MEMEVVVVCHQSLKDRLKDCGGRQGEQTRMVPSFPGFMRAQPKSTSTYSTYLCLSG